MVSTGRRLVAVALSAILAASPLVGCASTAQNANDEAAEQEDMVREGEEEEGMPAKTVPYSSDGEYVVTLKEGDFIKADDSDSGDAAEGDESDSGAAAEEEDASSGDATDGKKADESDSGDATDEKKADAVDAEALEEAKAELERAESARDEAQKALDEALEAEERARTEAEGSQDTAGEDVEVDAEEADIQEESDSYAEATKARERAEEALAEAEEAVKAAEKKVAALEVGTEQDDTDAAIEADAASDEEKLTDEATGQKKDLTFGDVKAEDVKVFYMATVGDAGNEADPEAEYEAREAQIDSLSNDNGTITLSFTDPDAASNATSSYCVTIDAMGLYAPVIVDIAQPMLTVDSGVASDSESSEVTIRVEDAMFADDVSADDITLGGSFANMSVEGVDGGGDAITVRLSGTPEMNYEETSTYPDGQIILSASAFENNPLGATAFVPVELPEEAFDLEGEEALPLATMLGVVDYVSFDGDTVNATIYLCADLGSFGDITPEGITLEDSFAGGKVESVSWEGEDGDLLKVEVSFPANGKPEDDYAFAGTLKLAAGAMTDEYGNPAPEVETTVALYPEEDMGRSEDEIEIDNLSDDSSKEEDSAKNKKDEPKDKKKDTTDETLGAAGAGIKYAGKWLKKVDPTLAKLANLSGELFNIAGNIYSGKWSKLVDNGIGLLKLCGISPDEKEVTAEDVLEEVKGLRSIVTSLDSKVTDISKEDREDRYTQTSVSLKQMQDYIARADVMFNEGARILANRKKNPMKAPGENASNEEVVKYNAELRSIMIRQQEKEQKSTGTKSTMFVDLDETMKDLRKELSKVTKWVSIQKGAINAGANPIDVFDKLVSMQFNWESQGYYARAAFRGELTYTMQKAWALVSTYYNATDPAVKGKYQSEADSVAEALEQVEARPAGIEPDEIRQLNQNGKDFKLYSPSLGFSIRRCRLANGGFEASAVSDERTANDRIDEFMRRLHGSLYDDLQLAGLEVGDENTNFDGIGLRHHVTTSTAYVRTGSWYTGGIRVAQEKFEIWTMIMFKDKSISAKKTFDGLRNAYEKTWYSGKTNKAYTFYWFDRA